MPQAIYAGNVQNEIGALTEASGIARPGALPLVYMRVVVCPAVAKADPL